MPLLSLAPLVLLVFWSAPTERDDGWRADLDFLVAEAQRVNPSPVRPAFSDSFEDAVDALRREIPELTDQQVLGRMMKLVAALNDGHSALYGPGPDSPLALEGRVLPLQFYTFPSGVYLVGGRGPWVDHAGSRVVRIGPLSTAEVLERLSAYRGVDNAMTWTWMGPQFYLPRLGMLTLAGVPVDDGTVTLTLADVDGQERTLVVPAGDEPPLRKLRPFPHAAEEPPLYLSNVDVRYWTQPLPEWDALFFQFNQVRDAPGESIAAFSGRLRRLLIDTDCSTLIVDVRHNNGGNNTLVRPLLRTLIEFEMRRDGNRVFVLMGRNTFSAAQNFINQVERYTNAVFVGEPSSSSPNFVGEENEVVLPYSRVRGSLSDRYWQDSDPWDNRPWIEPDFPVELTIDDYLAGHDPALEQVFAVIEER